MSLVLEALKKLDREKGREERGFVVMAAAPWPARAAARWPMWAALGMASAAVIVFLVLRAERPVSPLPAAPGVARAAGAPGVPAGSVAMAVPQSAPAAATARAGAPAIDGRGAAAARRALTVAAPAPDVPAPAAPGSVLQPFHPPAVAAPSTVTPPAVAASAGTPAPPPDPVLRLQAISTRDGQPIAIVNDHLVRVGDEFDGVRILAIRGTEVDVDVHGRRTTLRF